MLILYLAITCIAPPVVMQWLENKQYDYLKKNREARNEKR